MIDTGASSSAGTGAAREKYSTPAQVQGKADGRAAGVEAAREKADEAPPNPQDTVHLSDQAKEVKDELAKDISSMPPEERERWEKATELVDQYAPEDIKKLIHERGVSIEGDGTFYSADKKKILFSQDCASRYSPVDIARTLVHEGTHAQQFDQPNNQYCLDEEADAFYNGMQFEEKLIKDGKMKAEDDTGCFKDLYAIYEKHGGGKTPAEEQAIKEEVMDTISSYDCYKGTKRRSELQPQQATPTSPVPTPEPGNSTPTPAPASTPEPGNSTPTATPTPRPPQNQTPAPQPGGQAESNPVGDFFTNLWKWITGG
jgi:hypothetical protein